jgi:flavodoxin I
MKALVVYDSLYGNTEKIAQTIAATLASRADVAVLRVGNTKPEQLAGLSLLVAGAPTHGGRPAKPAADWLKSLPAGCLAGVKVAAFDTRVPPGQIKSRTGRFFVNLFGYHAAAAIAGALTKCGGYQVIAPEGFGVKDTEGPLAEGELERAAAWAHQILKAV